MKTWLGLGDLELKVTTELNMSNLSMFGEATSVFSENSTSSGLCLNSTEVFRIMPEFRIIDRKKVSKS